MNERREQVVYRIQKQYDFEAMRNEMSKRIIHRHRIITLLTIVVALIAIALAVSQIRLARIKKQESDLKNNLLLFMQQNKELSLKSESYKKEQFELEQKQMESDAAHRELACQIEKYKKQCETYEQKLKKALMKEQRIMQKMAVYINNGKDKASLEALQYSVFGNQNYWEAILKAFDNQFPEIRKLLIQKIPDLTETEQKILVLTYLDTSREDTALLLGISIFMVNKLRTSVRKKMSVCCY